MKLKTEMKLNQGIKPTTKVSLNFLAATSLAMLFVISISMLIYMYFFFSADERAAEVIIGYLNYA